MVLGDTEVSSPQTRLSRVQRVGWGRQKALPAPGGGAPPVSQNGHPRTCRKSPNKGPGGKRGRRHKSLQGAKVLEISDMGKVLPAITLQLLPREPRTQQLPPASGPRISGRP